MVWAWGLNSEGQLGDGTHTNRTVPVPVLSNIKAIAAGGFHSMALDAGGRVWVWGNNYVGQLGTSDTETSFSPVLMAGNFNTRIKAISAGLYHSLVLSDQGALFGCGDNDVGRAGSGRF